MAGVGRELGREAPLVLVAGVQHLEVLGNVGRDLPRDLAIGRARDDHVGAGVGDDLLELGWGKPPVQRDRDGPDLAGCEQQLDDLGGGAVEVRDPIPGVDAGLEQSLGEPVRAVVELCVSQRARTATDRDDVGPAPRMAADDIRHS